ncbi:MAG TPA: GNAT family N-acetyltransferase [Geminicoccaceae bacterium]|nr:GNAT family N-acetyltransferase [Geminicoccaceae bacterium]
MGVRPIGPGDLEAWCRMRRALWPEATPAELLEEAEAYLRGASPLQAVFLGAGPAGEPLGMLELSLRSVAEGCCTTPVPYVEGWYVVPEARRRGVGSGLMAAAEAWARARGYAEIASDAVIGNRLSERAHRALDFVEVERAIHFRKDLQAGGADESAVQGRKLT